MENPIWRTLSKGRCFVYVLACREQDTQKIGYARDPWARLRTFHPRFHAFFDLDRAAVVETDRVEEARAIERVLKRRFSESRAVAPLQVRERAGGKFEWFRGIHAQAMNALQCISADLGYPLHAPLSAWFRDEWLAQIDRISDWIDHEFEHVETWHFNSDTKLSEPRQHALRNLLEAWESIGLPLDERLTVRIRNWYRYGFEGA